MNQYAMYLRKSRADMEAEVRGEGETLARHENILLELAKKQNLIITKIYREIVSGETISSRPVMQQLLSDVEKNMWKGILVVEVERLARGDTIDQGLVAQTFKYSGTKIITPMKVYNPANQFDEEYFEFGLFMSRREYKTTNRRLQTGRLQSVKEGKYVGNKPPYGYIRKKLAKDKGYTLEPHPDQADIVKLIFRWYSVDRIGVSYIANRLNEMKVSSAKGGDWTPSTIRSILRNPVYNGKIRWNGRPQKKKVVDGEIVKERPRSAKEDLLIVDGMHEAIINDDIFALTQKLISERSTPAVPNKYKIKNPLAGIIICGICGRKMNRRPHPNYPDTILCTGPTCTNISSQLSLVEEKLLEALEAWLKAYKIKIKSTSSNQTLEIDVIKNSIEVIDKELETLKKQSNSLHDLLEQGVYSTEKFLERSKIITEKMDSAKADRTMLVNKLSESDEIEKNKNTIIPKVEKVLNVYRDLDNPADKNKLLKEVITKAVYTKEVNGRWHHSPDDFTIEVFPKLSKDRSYIT